MKEYVFSEPKSEPNSASEPSCTLRLYRRYLFLLFVTQSVSFLSCMYHRHTASASGWWARIGDTIQAPGPCLYGHRLNIFWCPTAKLNPDSTDVTPLQLSLAGTDTEMCEGMLIEASVTVAGKLRGSVHLRKTLHQLLLNELPTSFVSFFWGLLL